MAQLRAGAARADMTPRAGIAMAGGWRPQAAEGIETPLAAHALVLDDGDTTLAVVSLDLCVLPAEHSDAAKRRILESTGLPPEHVLLTCSHTHEAPYTCSLLGTDTRPDAEFMQRVGDAIVEAVAEAWQSRSPAEIASGSAAVPGLCQNRRRLKGPGDVFNTWMLPRDHTEAYPPAGPVDEEVVLLAVRRASGAPLATLWNFALHAHAFWKKKICADYPCYVGRRLADALGGDLVSVFTPGACGDINRPYDVAPETIVERLSDALIDLYAGLSFTGDVTPAAQLRPVEVALRDFSVFQEEEIRRKLPSALEVAREEWEILRRWAHRSERTVVHAMRIGEVALAGAPGEFFCALGLDVKRRSPFARTAVVELSNDYVGYIPTAEAFDQGGYELFNLRSSRVARGTGERMADELVGMLAALHATAHG